MTLPDELRDRLIAARERFAHDTAALAEATEAFEKAEFAKAPDLAARKAAYHAAHDAATMANIAKGYAERSVLAAVVPELCECGRPTRQAAAYHKKMVAAGYL